MVMFLRLASALVVPLDPPSAAVFGVGGVSGGAGGSTNDEPPVLPELAERGGWLDALWRGSGWLRGGD